MRKHKRRITFTQWRITLLSLIIMALATKQSKLIIKEGKK